MTEITIERDILYNLIMGDSHLSSYLLIFSSSFNVVPHCIFEQARQQKDAETTASDLQRAVQPNQQGPRRDFNG